MLSSKSVSYCWLLLCLIRCFLSDEECLELAWLWNHRKFRVKTLEGLLLQHLKNLKALQVNLSVHSVLDCTMTRESHKLPREEADGKHWFLCLSSFKKTSGL